MDTTKLTPRVKRKPLPDGWVLQSFTLGRVIGLGGFGIVYAAEDQNLGKVAIKEFFPNDISARDGRLNVKPDVGKNNEYEKQRKRFIEEARLLQDLNDVRNIVNVRHVIECNNTVYMVMNYIHGQTLQDYLASELFCSEGQLINLVRPLLRALEEVHKHNRIHRDIKPGNIIITSKGEPILLDFGAARDPGKTNLTAMVTPNYAPPEQYYGAGADTQGPWTDIYSVAALLYGAIGGTLVESPRRRLRVEQGMQDPLPSAIVVGEGKYSDTFLKAIDWALNLGTTNRPQSVRSWQEQLIAPAPQPAEPAESVTTKRWLLSASAVVLVAGAVMIGELLVFTDDEYSTLDARADERTWKSVGPLTIDVLENDLYEANSEYSLKLLNEDGSAVDVVKTDDFSAVINHDNTITFKWNYRNAGATADLAYQIAEGDSIAIGKLTVSY